MTIPGNERSIEMLGINEKTGRAEITVGPEIHRRFFNFEGLRIQLVWSFRGDECTASIHCNELGIDITTISGDLDEALITLGEAFYECLKDLNLLKDSFMFGYRGRERAPIELK